MSEIKINKLCSLTGSNNDITIDPDGTGDTIIASGNVGIGTTSPDALLELYRAGTSELMIGSDNAGTAQLSFYEGTSSTKEGFLKYDGASNNVVLGTSGAANAVNVARDTGAITVKGEGSATTSVQQGLAKLWATLNADASTVVAFDSFNVSSVQDDGTGKYGVTASSAMSNANYYMCGVCSHHQQTQNFDRYISNNYSGGNIDARKTTTQLKTGSYGTGFIETYVVGLSVHGDLA